MKNGMNTLGKYLASAYRSAYLYHQDEFFKAFSILIQKCYEHLLISSEQLEILKNKSYQFPFQFDEKKALMSTLASYAGLKKHDETERIILLYDQLDMIFETIDEKWIKTQSYDERFFIGPYILLIKDEGMKNLLSVWKPSGLVTYGAVTDVHVSENKKFVCRFLFDLNTLVEFDGIQEEFVKAKKQEAVFYKELDRSKNQGLIYAGNWIAGIENNKQRFIFEKAPLHAIQQDYVIQCEWDLGEEIPKAFKINMDDFSLVYDEKYMWMLGVNVFLHEFDLPLLNMKDYFYLSDEDCTLDHFERKVSRCLQSKQYESKARELERLVEFFRDVNCTESWIFPDALRAVLHYCRDDFVNENDERHCMFSMDWEIYLRSKHETMEDQFQIEIILNDEELFDKDGDDYEFI